MTNSHTLSNLLVSFTGIDDIASSFMEKIIATYRRASLAGLATEWGILIHPEKTGEARCPTYFTQRQIAEQLPTAAHLCGKIVFENLLTPLLRRQQLMQLRHFARVQININARQRDFTTDQVKMIYSILQNEDYPIILQYHEDSASDIDAWLSTQVSGHSRKIHILNDASRGKGISPENWSTAYPGMINGYAGGLNPVNVVDELDKIEKFVPNGNSFWIDMESGIREGNRFSYDKVDQVVTAILNRYTSDSVAT